MASRYHKHQAPLAADLIDLSTEEELYSVSEEEPTQRNANDLRLTQAINYLAEEGGDDSPTTYILRVDRIDEALLQQLPLGGRDFDLKLYRRLQAMVRGVQREYAEAVEENSGRTEASDDDLPEYYTSYAAEEALYKEADEAEEPPVRPSAPLRSRVGGSKDNVQREKEFKYGGPRNELENWHREFPASLPFPETLQMAHWESLKIDYDLSRSAEDGPNVVENSIPFNHPQLEQYKDLHQYDSGSRYKLPLPVPSDEERINELGTEQKLKEAVNAFNIGYRDEEITKDYAPRVVLDKFVVGRQVSPTAIRQSINITPTKPRRTSNVSVASSVGSKNRRISSERTLPFIIEEGLADGIFTVADTDSPEPPVEAPAKRPQTPRSPSQVSTSQSKASRAFRRISDSRREALRASPRRESVSSTGKQTRVKKHAARIEIPVKRGLSRPRKVPKAKAPAPAVEATLSTKTLGKRKRSAGSETYTPDGKRKKSVGSEEFTPSSLKKKTRATARNKEEEGA
ncbi:uncharacterized protein K460DRAFT_397974 [Cucurbitaria berberidis CBS 394.84]|uniref:Uncharacterized protein n=1 Tax=Cucurbitaria berberidis CBS 394.84 TaxID=1168544 RepID=A0A9P4G9V8_9PLEO|nr:uncharacterized protein K460DRAFT_397974 [Cucurbitaria berberidis CBS 394.84]KAF1841843.1 hypothetical protein K460DRAFT_397974 [Cucurbitaria berberidis CBS 394.84]